MLQDAECYGTQEAKMPERCKPDYESMINNVKEKLALSEPFRDAALAYFRNRRASGKMAELIGELVTECNKYQEQIARIVEAQEKDSE